jgi:hypothetical protein
MTRRKRGVLILLGFLSLLAAAEVGLTWWRGPQGCVEVHNEGAEPILGLTLTYGGAQVVVPKVEPKGTARAYFGGRRAGTLSMRFNQKGNGLGAFELPGFNPAQLSHEGFKQMLLVRTNAIEKYQDDAEPESGSGLLLQSFWKYVEDSFSEVTAP